VQALSEYTPKFADAETVLVLGVSDAGVPEANRFRVNNSPATINATANTNAMLLLLSIAFPLRFSEGNQTINISVQMIHTNTLQRDKHEIDKPRYKW